MFEFFMLIGFLGAGLCHLLPVEEDRSGRREKVGKKKKKRKEPSRAAKALNCDPSGRKRPAGWRKCSGQGSFPRAA